MLSWICLSYLLATPSLPLDSGLPDSFPKLFLLPTPAVESHPFIVSLISSLRLLQYGSAIHGCRS